MEGESKPLEQRCDESQISSSILRDAARVLTPVKGQRYVMRDMSRNPNKPNAAGFLIATYFQAVAYSSIFVIAYENFF